MIQYFLLSSNTVNTPPPPLAGVLPYVSNTGGPFWSEKLMGIHWGHFGLESGMILRELHKCMNVFIVSIANE